ncbi:MAG TPA: hypothetical protein VFV02_07710 [Acidimicrobiales bacterium]|nr:hypothetical protein [Acidimicrobiales bacterium]
MTSLTVGLAPWLLELLNVNLERELGNEHELKGVPGPLAALLSGLD